MTNLRGLFGKDPVDSALGMSASCRRRMNTNIVVFVPALWLSKE